MTAEIQDPRTGQWLPYPANDNGRGNIRIDGQAYSHDAGAAAYQQAASAATAAPPAPDGPAAPAGPAAPLSPDDPNFDPNVNTPTTWDPGTNQPKEVFPGWHWDPGMFRYVHGDAPAPSGGGTGGDTGGGGGGTPSPGPAPTYGLPPSGFGAPPPRYVSDPNAPVYTPLPAYVPPTWTGGDFVNPSEADLQASPGYQARLDRLMTTRERGAAAQGTLLTGGTLKALDRAGQDYASNEYQTFRNNALEAYRQKYSQFTDAAGMNFAARTLNANENQTAFQNRTNIYNTGNARTLSDYLTNITAQRNAELDYWGRLQDVNGTGAGLAGGSYRA